MDEIIHKKGKIYYTMGEVTEMFGVNASLLRYWEQEFDKLRPHRNKKGNRLYTPQDVDLVRTIYHLVKEKKMKIEVARKYLKENKTEADRDSVIVEKLMSIRAILQEIKNDLAYEGEVVDDSADEDYYTDTITTPEPAAAKKQDRETPPLSSGAEQRPVKADKDIEDRPSATNAGVPMFEEQMLFQMREIEVAVAKDTSIDHDTQNNESGNDETENDSTKPAIIEQTLF